MKWTMNIEKVISIPSNRRKTRQLTHAAYLVFDNEDTALPEQEKGTTASMQVTVYAARDIHQSST